MPNGSVKSMMVVITDDAKEVGGLGKGGWVV